jgi:glycerol-3-phosphate dehydrogenase (NAD(P)+)
MADKISVIGSGSWATAITKILTENGHDVHWWVRTEETAAHIRQFKHNPNYLSMVEFEIPPQQVTTNLKKAFETSDWIVLAVPSYYVVDVINKLTPADFQGKKFISAIKGIIQEGNLLISQFLHKQFEVNWESITNVSGPCHAEEVAAEKQSYLTFASPNEQLAQHAAALFNNRFIKASWCTDLKGTEYAAVLKNVYALAAGISIGLGYGDNFRAVLVSSAMQEMQIFLTHLLDGERNILTSPYLGDILVTAYSQHSRNRSFGLMIGRGYTVNAAKLELNMVAEGYFSTRSLKLIADQNKINLPVLNAVFNILYENISPGIEMHLLAGKLS